MTERLAIPFPAPDTGTVAYWRSAAPSYGCRAWREAMRRFARQHGQAVAMLADDSALVVTRCPVNASGVSESRWPAHCVTWRRGQA